MSEGTAIAGGRGFIGRRLCAALPGAAAFGREGPPPGPRQALVWAAGGRSGDEAELHEQHAAAAARAIAELQPRRVVYLGSAEIYGQQPAPFTESTPPAPTTPYGRAKQAGEAAAAAACARVGAALVVLRVAVVYGPDQPPTMLLPAALAALRAGAPFPTTDGLQTRDFLHVDDLAALVKRCLADDAPPGTYNAGSGHEVRVRDALLMLAAAAAAPASLLQFGARERRPGEAMRYVLDVRRARERLGWTAALALSDGLEDLARRP